MKQSNKRILILTYYWPPSGGAGVQRWLKFVKYLPEFGYTPVVYTHSNGEVPSIDESLLNEIPQEIEVIKTDIWEPYDVYKKITGKKGEKINSGFLSEKEEKSSFLQNLAIAIRGNFFIPDARKFWIKPSVRFLSKYLIENPVDVIISSGPPHTMHLIAMKLKKKLDIPWIADFRDPWTNIDFYHELRLSKWADKKHHRLEKEVLNNADSVISVGETLSNELSEIGNKKVITITNGYDEDDYEAESKKLDSKFTIAHIGSMNKARNPILLWQSLSELIQENPEFKNKLEIKLVGKVDFHVKESIEKYGLSDLYNRIDYLPHEEVLLEQQKSHLLLLVVNEAPNAKGIITGKVFEYLASGRPILALAPENGDLQRLINYTNSGKCISSAGSIDDMKRLIIDFFEGEYLHQPINLEKFTRKNLTKKLVEVIKEFT